MNLRREDIGHHVSSQFNEDLLKLRDRVLDMARLVQQQLRDAVTAIDEDNEIMAAGVIMRAADVDTMEVMLDEECTRVIVRRQPAAGDLRFVFAVIKTITDLERIGNQAGRIARTVMEPADESRQRFGALLRHLGERVAGLLAKSLAAFAQMSVATALEVAQEDVAIDEEFDTVMRQIMTYMMEDPRTISWALNLAWAARSLERIGDHAKNISEYVIYMVQGTDIRHISIEERARRVLEAAR